MANELRNIRIKRLALVKRGANRVNKKILKSADGLSSGRIFADETPDEVKARELIEKARARDSVVVDILMEIGTIADQLKKAEIKPEDGADMLDDILVSPRTCPNMGFHTCVSCRALAR